jgi:hypothetical protein
MSLHALEQAVPVDCNVGSLGHGEFLAARTNTRYGETPHGSAQGGASICLAHRATRFAVRVKNHFNRAEAFDQRIEQDTVPRF